MCGDKCKRQLLVAKSDPGHRQTDVVQLLADDVGRNDAEVVADDSKEAAAVLEVVVEVLGTEEVEGCGVLPRGHVR